MNDNSLSLQAKVQDAFADKQALVIQGSGSKDFYGFTPATNEILSALSHTGITSYEPNELVLTARAGTPLKEIEECLAQHDQMLSCEAPHFGDKASFGGMIAAGLSGPARPFTGSISDLILGCKILNGKGEILQFGGKVMKNVAGYDNSRLMAGSMGCLGIILEATVKVVPRWKATRSFRFAVEQEKMTVFVNKLTSLGYSVTASAYENNALLIRFSAGEKEIENLDSALQKDFSFIDFEEELRLDYWLNLREQKLDFFNSAENLWRLSLSPNNPIIDIPGETLLEWNGAQRWLKTEAKSVDVFKIVSEAGGTATLFKSNQKKEEEFIFQPLAQPLMHWQQQLKQAFDPAGIFNPGRMYRDL